MTAPTGTRTAVSGTTGGHAWAMDPDALRTLTARIGGPIGHWADADPQAVARMYAARENRAAGAVGVVHVLGPLTRRDTVWTVRGGGTSYPRIVQQVRALAADRGISSIVLDIDSGGGEAIGASEAAAAIRQARTSKPVVAIVSGAMLSAAAWLGWSASEVIATPDSIIGSQGVFTLHVDSSKALEMAGIKPTYIGSSGAKVAGRPGLPLDDETRAEMQSMVDELDRLFKADVATARGLTPAQVKDRYGNGAVFTAREAKSRGMVDRIETYGTALSRLSGARAEDDDPEPQASEDPADPTPNPPADGPDPEAEAKAAASLELDRAAWLLRR